MVLARLRLRVHGLVQGVGFRPFAYRLARELNVSGWVRNSHDGAWVVVEGPPQVLGEFCHRLRTEAPPPCHIHRIETSSEVPVGESTFAIAQSESQAPSTALILPDLATCPDCLREILDPTDRRYRYPFTTCTHCGPRYSIIESLPYDRERTVMRKFPLCDACRDEYQAPGDRRFHAEPIACPDCGPQLSFHSAEGSPLATREQAMALAVGALRDGAIVAVKGLGGYQLLVRADSDAAVRRLRSRKHREAKPLALMCPDLAAAATIARISPTERRLLLSPAAPIVLLERLPTPDVPVARSVAPDNPWLGVMLPTTPLHHLLLTDLGLIVVATSGNPSEEPLCTENLEAQLRLRSIADFFLHHDRPIARPLDDSVARVLLDTDQVLRRARGYAPLPLWVASTTDGGRTPSILALGAQLKSTVAVSRGDQFFLSPHIGDLESAVTCETFRNTVQDLTRWLEVRPAVAAIDLHPDYFSSQFAATLGVPVSSIPHHEAHALSGLLDHGLRPPVLALVWDGTGLGPDGTLWGGDFLEITDSDCRRRASFRYFPLPGGDAASRDTRRCALGVLHEAGLLESAHAAAFLERVFEARERIPLRIALTGKVHAPQTTSVGRLFDAVASLLHLTQTSRFEGEAAMQLENAAWQARSAPDCRNSSLSTSFHLRETDHGLEVDWRPFMQRLVNQEQTLSTGGWALAWHDSLIDIAVRVVQKIGLPQVVLTGGCFQNRLLTEGIARALAAVGFQVHWHQRIPPNDGGIAMGQVLGAWRRFRNPGGSD
ncbi:MAG: carbamoyltransferase HypF [Verrucomicrobiales bacterium]|nr:carbamoyltransferase HypF [Verrucomicrobiales bacterium]